MKYYIQMFSIRDVAETDLKKALEIVAEAGYAGVELCGTFGNSAASVRSWLDEYHLECFSVHTSRKVLAEELENTIRYYQELGVRYFVLPGAPTGTKEELDTTIDLINKYQKILAREGISFAYHNHYHEYLPNADGLIAHREIERRTNIDFELDTYWTLCGGFDPLHEMERLKARIKVVHLKDGIVEQRISTAIGLGNAPVKAIRDHAHKLGFKMVVESEGLQPSGTAEILQCIKYLRTLQ